MEDWLKIGLIQTTLDNHTAWSQNGHQQVAMNVDEENRIWHEIKKGMTNIKSQNQNPQIICLPELTIPISRLNGLINLSKKIGSVIIGGLDFAKYNRDKVRNRAVVIIPTNWPNLRRSYRANLFFLGKTFFSHRELRYFESQHVQGIPDPTMYLLNGGDFGNIGVVICSDIFDLERLIIYKARIQHLIIIAYNQDINTFYGLAESISRLVFCNVVICNTGNHGGSIVYSPYKEIFRRNIYKHEGAKLFTTQIVKLPVNSLYEHQHVENPLIREFKSLPPGYHQPLFHRGHHEIDL
jgi:hypothetical protein